MIHIFPILETIFGLFEKERSPIILLVWNLKLISGIPKPLDETLEVDFFNLDNLPKLAFEHDYEIIKDWLKKSKIS